MTCGGSYCYDGTCNKCYEDGVREGAVAQQMPPLPPLPPLPPRRGPAQGADIQGRATATTAPTRVPPRPPASDSASAMEAAMAAAMALALAWASALPPSPKRGPMIVVPLTFSPGETHGDFGAMHESGLYKHTVFLFNDSTRMWQLAGENPLDPASHMAGGGNACVRPLQISDGAIGMPTGPFASLDEVVPGYGLAKDVINAAFARIVLLFLRRWDKNVLFYSAKSAESTQIGLGIFAGRVGDDVVKYISEGIQLLPAAIARAAAGGPITLDDLRK